MTFYQYGSEMTWYFAYTQKWDDIIYIYRDEMT